MFRFNGKVAIVTGGGRGIGKAISRILASQGAKVAIADLRGDIARETAEEINSAGGQCIAIETDVTNLESVKKMVDMVHQTFGTVDILVNNAGWDQMMLFKDTTPDFWDKIIDINYKGVLNTVYAVMNDMVGKKKGRIISISSDAARVGSTGEAVYSGAKGAIISFSKTMARELARYNITVNVICPGPTETPLVEELKQDSDLGSKILGSMEKIIPLRRMGKPEDIAYAVCFFASDEAGFITGQVLSVSGGLTMC
ncbi:MAG: glucose 1-dehydrogenase [Deltaproteobacteria bacterium]|nr:glucose 1-dehydrogenase [Deltaproteobacteria bacterium]MBW2069318.1 glucose 1-dehydrogenase [Deltaproteobacteria bacterium]